MAYLVAKLLVRHPSGTAGLTQDLSTAIQSAAPTQGPVTGKVMCSTYQTALQPSAGQEEGPLQPGPLPVAGCDQALELQSLSVLLGLQALSCGLQVLHEAWKGGSGMDMLQELQTTSEQEMRMESQCGRRCHCAHENAAQLDTASSITNKLQQDESN